MNTTNPAKYLFFAFLFLKFSTLQIYCVPPVPVHDAGNTAVATKNSMTNLKHSLTTAYGWVKQLIESVEQTLRLGEIIKITNFIQDFTNEIMNAFGTVKDIMALPKTILSDIENVVGSYIGLFVDTYGTVKNTWDEAQVLLGEIVNYELNTNFSTNPWDYAGQGHKLKNKANYSKLGGSPFTALSKMRAIQTSSSLKYLDPERMKKEEGRFSEAVALIENADNAAEMQRGQAQIQAEIKKELAHANQMEAMNIQRKALEDLSRIEEIKAREAASTTEAKLHLLYGLIP